jgi:glycosyltransferase involved in cell wall biosynthesis
MLGTIEPRKGHAYVLDQFEILWESGHSVSLKLIGKAGWNCEELIHRIHNLILSGKKIQWFSNATDDEVATILSESAFLICASTHEGYSLPGIEAHSLGLGVIARNTPIYREVLGEFAYFFEDSVSEDAIHLSSIIQNIIEGGPDEFYSRLSKSTFSSSHKLLETSWGDFIK